MAKIDRGFDPDNMPKWLSKFWNKRNYKHVISGINDDDCAILKVGTEELVISVDYLNANPIALEFGIATYMDLGRLLVAVNLSDLCGTGAKPIGFLTALMFNREEAEEAQFKLLMRGIKHELNKFKVPLIGGDTKLGNANSLCGVAIGKKESGAKLFLKSKAQIGDSIYVSANIGNIGAAVSGLKENIMDQKWNAWALKQITRTNIPLQMSLEISKARIGNGGTDLSDGLGADLGWLCEASDVGAIVYAEQIPLSENVRRLAAVKKLPPWYYALTIGGDFQFLVTCKNRHTTRLSKMGLTKIGEITREKEAYLKFQGTKVKMPRAGHRDARAMSFSEEVDMILSGFQKTMYH